MVQGEKSRLLKIFTIGHSNHSLEVFLNLLKRSDIQVAVDIRSNPNSKVALHFNRGRLGNYLKASGIKYLYFGKELGGRPQVRDFYDSSGRVLYNRIAETPGFIKCIERLMQGVQDYRVALLCSEENPVNCHRRLLVGRVLRDYGVRIEHIRGDGKVQSEEEVRDEEGFKREGDSQLRLFENEESSQWKSIQSVLPRRVPKNSSEH